MIGKLAKQTDGREAQRRRQQVLIRRGVCVVSFDQPAIAVHLDVHRDDTTLDFTRCAIGLHISHAENCCVSAGGPSTTTSPQATLLAKSTFPSQIR